jgi:hypothetical protein
MSLTRRLRCAYMPQPNPIQVLVTADGAEWQGFAEAWRDDRVYVRYTTGPGQQHLHWVDAAQVRRVGSNAEEPPPTGP